MKPSPATRFGLALVLALAALRLPAESVESYICGHGHVHSLRAAGGLQPGMRQYAPSRIVDIRHLALDITPDFARQSIRGSARLTFVPISEPVRELRLDAAELLVTSVTGTEAVQGWQSGREQLVITFAQPVAAGREATVTIQYSAVPTHGLYFRTPAQGYPEGDSHLWSQGEPIESRHWFPSFDAPNEKFTSEVTCRVPDGMTVLSNGRQVSSELDAATGLRAVRWLQDKPHVSYLIALAAGHLKGIEDKHRDIPLGFFTPASKIDLARSSFEGTKDMMEFFEKETGVPYPWDKYYQVAVADYHWGGMENTSLTILNDYTLFGEGFETLRSSESLVAHELAHQWFGDLVTCKDWSHLWLNEGFATYYDALYQGHRHGRDQFLYTMYQSAEGILAVTDDRLPIVHRKFDKPEEQFSFRAYPKGSWILHMLRSQLGETLYRKCVQTYLERHRFGTVETEDLVRVFEELSGRSLDGFFDQYVYHAQQPDLKVAYEWRESEKLAKISVSQVQKVSDDVLLFSLPLKIRFRTPDGVQDREVVFNSASEDFYFALPQAPTSVRFDPDFTLLARVDFPLPGAMLNAQLEDSSDMIGRLLAIRQLSQRRDPETIGKLKKLLLGDGFHGVRTAAAKALRKIDTTEAREALLAAGDQKDARVRLQVFQSATAPYHDASLGRVLQVVASEKNPDIAAQALRSLGAYSRPETRAPLLSALGAESHNFLLADAALSAIRQQNDPALLPAVLTALRTNASRWPVGVRAEAMETAASLARFQTNRDEVRELLLSQVDAKRERLQLAAIRSLGTLGDPAAIGALERFTSLDAGDRARIAASRAVDTLRAARPAVVEFGDVRNEVLSLKQENKDLRKDLEALRKKLESISTPPPAPSKAPAAGKPEKKPREPKPRA